MTDEDRDRRKEKRGAGYAVQISSDVQRLLQKYGDLPFDDHQWSTLRFKGEGEPVERMILTYFSEVLEAMDESKEDSPGRGGGPLSEELVNRFNEWLDPLTNSFVVCKNLAQILRDMKVHRKELPGHTRKEVFLREHFLSKPAYQRFHRLESYIHRQSIEYRIWAKGYYSDPKVKAKKKLQSKKAQAKRDPQEERDRKRVEYWAKKGMQPPPRLEKAQPLEEEIEAPVEQAEHPTTLQ